LRSELLSSSSRSFLGELAWTNLDEDEALDWAEEGGPAAGYATPDAVADPNGAGRGGVDANGLIGLGSTMGPE